MAVQPSWVALAFLGCGTPVRPPLEPTDPGAPGQFAEVDRFVPSYSKAELQQALIRERAAEATGERIVNELADRDGSADQLRVARADLAVRRRMIAALEACEASGVQCPPRLDEPTWSYDPDGPGLDAPPIDSQLRFDVASWRVIANELHGRACSCRTLHCVDSLAVAIDRLEGRPMPDVQGDESASLAITRARECLFWLSGKRR